MRWILYEAITHMEYKYKAIASLMSYALRAPAQVNLGYKGFPICQAKSSPINCLWQLIFEFEPFRHSQR